MLQIHHCPRLYLVVTFTINHLIMTVTSQYIRTLRTHVPTLEEARIHAIFF